MTKDSRCGFCSRVLACWELVLEPQLPHLENENATSPITKGCCELQQRVPEMHWPETLLCKWQLLGFPPQDRASLPLSLVPCLELASSANHKCVHCPGPLIPNLQDSTLGQLGNSHY